MQLCQAQRFCVNFDDGMKRLLQGYWDILCARRAVAVQTTPTNGTNGNTNGNTNGGVIVPAAPPARSKRTLERSQPEDEGMDLDDEDQDDLERFGGRQFAPFRDQPL
ncbi:hypothetical protein HII31_01817 [Pseudocercospora fuligena]|uniref:Uncharacterized protein n=1 Tax=Pseudocercospora fuligena TaxID=685502 RepID=A0A8H6RSX6_9PEZI|nr:hypothetical protein HII31_01817 [Pseudocercospora fuligena]